MATYLKNLSDYQRDRVPNGAKFRVGIVVSQWNDDITLGLLKGAEQTLLENGVEPDNIIIRFVPGTFELPLGAQMLLEADEEMDGVIAIGCVIQGETRHFDFVCEGATKGIMDVQLEYGVPVSFCVLTDNTKQQSIDRSGGKHGNKGVECAVACMQMIGLQKELEP
ncbi:6,7-dimethyl-8-ribityllumazine synthase [Paracrocinitomix mangrovi]|uniref:6,7-dimethyl-8-ribityllumazine synthase n=1 Tax=Paracrocinitomix mangrovi TaxID=2862509 RepID=UPI001C8DBE9B|nr:6,7-dimethyl-8-ribityllumazine synthase [Paracrocinitomix mangrovi]UKN01659.1 6,7-dimethyl-8-ribityllumazine synthase [Paracrocinitomix mangrovi]